MAAKRTAVKAKKPVSVWKKPVKLDLKELLFALSRGVVDRATSNWGGLADDATQAIGAIGLDTTPGEIAWTLVCRSTVRAMFDLLGEMMPFPGTATPPDEDRLLKGVEEAVEKEGVVLEPSFFRRPTNLPLLKVLEQPIHGWLVAHGAEEADARCIVRRLPSYFVYALHEEWQKRRSDYARLKDVLDTPFTRASEREQAWERYAARLQRQINEPMFGEAFGIALVYVPLRGYYEEPIEKAKDEPDEPLVAGLRGERVRRVVVDLERELIAWAEEGNKDDALRVIAGGPGSGKSSFAKIFAVRQSEKGRRVLYVPLHLIDPEKDLEHAIGQFVRQQGILEDNPLDARLGEERLLLLLDGLDELAMQGKAAAEVAQKLILEVQRLLSNRNHAEARVQVVLGGREIVVQMSRSELRKPRQVLHVLPYHLTAQEQMQYRDPSKLLASDQRDLWWSNYAAAKGTAHDAMPKELRRPDLDEVTAQPLLGFLVALSHGRGEIDFKEEVNRNQIYADLVKAVHERSYGDNPHPSIRGLELPEFSRLLEEVAVAAWHGDGRTTTSDAIFHRCDRSGLRRFLDTFEEGARAGTTRLLAAFYFRQHGTQRDGARTFEFTHKSFGEYLIAKRIIRTLEDIHEEMDRGSRNPGKGWDERHALYEWAQIFGPTPMDQHILRFVVDEVRLRDQDHARAKAWQDRIAHLIGWMLRHGMPVDKLDPRPAYSEEVRQARNAEEALLACVYACASTTKIRTVVNWPDMMTFGGWIRRLQGQRSGPANVLALGCLAFLNLQHAKLHMCDLYAANLEDTDLSGAQANSAVLLNANLTHANLTHANLTHANLMDANLTRAELTDAELAHANLTRANLTRANLTRAKLTDANLTRAKLTDANLTRANLARANLIHANLMDANLMGAKLRDAGVPIQRLAGARGTPLSRPDPSVRFAPQALADDPATGLAETEQDQE